MNSGLQQRVHQIVAETFGIDADDVDDSTSQQTLDAWTSLAHLRLLTTLQSAFGVRFTMQEMSALTRVSAIEKLLAERGA